MHISLSPFLYIWLVLVAAVIVLFLWRQAIARREDDSIHVLQGSTHQQVTVAQKLDQIDKWGKLVTIIAVIYGVILGAAAIMQAFVSPGTSGV